MKIIVIITSLIALFVLPGPLYASTYDTTNQNQSQYVPGVSPPPVRTYSYIPGVTPLSQSPDHAITTNNTQSTVNHLGQDCNANAIIYCGVTSRMDLSSKLASGDGSNSAANIQAAMASQGINMSSDMSNLADGSVDNQGNVYINGQRVATDAKSLGRQYMAGSTAVGPFWLRPTSVSFGSQSLPAYVNMDGGTFHWAIIKSCGNPVVATPVAPITKSGTMAPAPTYSQPPTYSTPSYSPNPLPVTGSQSASAGMGLVASLLISLGIFGLIQSRHRLLSALTRD